MNYYQAHMILDQIKDNQHHSLQTINHALQLTGDLPDNFDALCQIGSAKGLESLCLGSDTRIGQ